SLPANIGVRVAVSRFPSRELWGHLYNIIEAAFRQGDVNHITGDVHYLTLLLRKKRTLLTIHDLVSLYRLKGIRRKIFLFFWYWLPIKRVAIVTVISQSTKDDLLRHIKVDPQKVRVIYNCVSEDYHPTPKKFITTKPVILQVGTRHNKNIERVAEALNGIPCHFRIIGLLNAKQKIILQKYGIEYSFAFNISDEQIVDEYRRCDMMVFASTYEGFGLPIIEAQAIGRPVVTSNLLSIPEVAGNAACLIDPFNVTSIRNGIMKVIENTHYRDKLIQQGYKNAKRFRPEIIAKQYVNIYKELLAR
ncbi:MAG: glycosyltransferase family 4 protein, partial [Candidatus Omnitrophica bacterium]|nr:glycosyltransferase family 4 protein [Candidatus Omnitrophota bacterium]